MRFVLKSNIQITVVIPTLNIRSQFLYETINSVIKQSYQPLEIIIVNNGNGELRIPDSAIPIKQLKIIYKAGVAQARNFGACFAKGDYIAFLDDDDLWDLDYLKNIKKRIDQEHPDCLLASIVQLLDGKILPYKNVDNQLFKDILLVRNPGITGSSVVIKKKIFFEVGGYNPKLPPSEDKSLVLELLKNSFKIVVVPESKIVHRQHDRNNRLTSNKFLMEGTYQFYRMYGAEMNFSQKINNLHKIYKYIWLNKKSIVSSLIYFFFFACVLLQKLMKKLKIFL